MLWPRIVENYGGDDDLFLVRVMARVSLFFPISKMIMITEVAGKFEC